MEDLVIAAGCETCGLGLPDLWVCLEEGCASVGCGRSKAGHALMHSTKEAHQIVVKALTLEMWCYGCRKWLGQVEEKRGEQAGEELRKIEGSQLELDVVKEIERRLGMSQEVEDCNLRRKIERSWELNAQKEFFLVSSEWYARWRLFLIGDIDTPGPVVNAGLLERLLTHKTGEAMAPRLGTDYYVLMGENWDYLLKTYGGGPPIEDTNPVLTWQVRMELMLLREEIHGNANN